MIETQALDPEVAAVACSVLMPVLNEEHNIEASVAAMRSQRFPGELEFLVVDGGSTDRTPEILAALAREDPRIRVLANPRRITSSGLNAALGQARGRWVARMDAHTEYPDDYLWRGAERLSQGGTRWVSGLAIATGQAPFSRAVALALRTPLGRGASRKWVARGAEAEHDLDSGVFAGVWERSTLLEYGGWDENWARNQDSEMAGRFLARGETLVLIPTMGASYVPRGSLLALARQYFQYGEFRTKTATRHPQTMRRSHLLAPAVVIATGASLAGPRALRRLSRTGLAAYSLILVGVGVQTLGVAERRVDATLVPVVLATMHLSHGAGALVGSVRFGPPLAALATSLGLPRLGRALAPPVTDVFAPSLQEALAAEDVNEGLGSRRNGETQLDD